MHKIDPDVIVVSGCLYLLLSLRLFPISIGWAAVMQGNDFECAAMKVIVDWEKLFTCNDGEGHLEQVGKDF